MEMPAHDDYRAYTKEQLEELLRTSPRHQDRDVVIRYLHDFQRKEAEQRAEQEAAKLQEKAELDEKKANERDAAAAKRHKENRNVTIVGIVMAAFVAIGIAVYQHRANTPSGTPPTDGANIAPSAAPLTSPTPSLPTPLPTIDSSAESKSDTATAKPPVQSPPLSPTPTETPIKWPPPAP